MASYGELARAIAEEIAAGAIGEGRELPALRALARDRGASQATALRAYRELAEAGIITTEERRVGHVAPGGALAAARYLRGGGIFRLAGSDDPALLLLLGEVASTIELVAADGSAAGLAALQAGRADGATRASLAHVGHLQRAVRARRGRRRAPGAAVEPRGRVCWSRPATPVACGARPISAASASPAARSAPAPARCSTA